MKIKNLDGLTATEYALVLGVVSLTLVAGFEAVTNEFTKAGDAGADGEFGTADDVEAQGIFAKVIAKLQTIAENI